MARSNALTRGRKAQADRLVAGGQLRDALSLYRRVTETDRADVEAWVKRGIVERRLGQFSDAEASCRRAVALRPRLAVPHYTLGSALQCLGRSDEAMACYRTAIALEPTLADPHYLLGNACHEQGRLADAIALYRRAIALRPDYPEALSNLGAVLLTLGQWRDAEPLLQRSLSLRPNDAVSIANLGVVREYAGHPAEALVLLRRARQLDPDSAVVAAQLASLLERQGQLVQAGAILERVPAAARDAAEVATIRARVARDQGHPELAVNLLQAALAGESQGADPIVIGEMHLLLGQLLDRLGVPSLAYQHLESGNGKIAAAVGIDTAAPPDYLHEVERARHFLAGAPVEHQPDNDDPATTPVFLIGFPRSGTTLLEQILDSHPKLQTLDEKPAVNAMAAAFTAMAGNDAQGLSTLDPGQVAQLRTVYFKEAERHLDRRAGAVLVDKLPLNIVWTHLIQRVFPHARFLLALRHPCDVCLSCFMQNFAINQAMRSFLTLSQTVQTYASVMGLWLDQNRLLAIRPHAVRYEDLVEDFEQVVTGTLKFVGVGWDDAVCRHVEHARHRAHISTPSYHQVTQPIYGHARYRWRQYAAQFDAHTPILQPFIEAFGYA